jgi:hypothetical protein
VILDRDADLTFAVDVKAHDVAVLPGLLDV